MRPVGAAAPNAVEDVETQTLEAVTQALGPGRSAFASVEIGGGPLADEKGVSHHLLELVRRFIGDAQCV